MVEDVVATVGAAAGSSVEEDEVEGSATTSVGWASMVVEGVATVGATTGVSVVDDEVVGSTGALDSTGAGVSTGVDVGDWTGISGVMTVVSVTVDEDSRVVVGSTDTVDAGVELAVTVT